MDNLWKDVLSDLEAALPAHAFATWVAPLHPVRLSDGRATVEVPNKFFIDWLQEHDYVSLIRASLVRQAGREIEIDFVVQPEEKAYLRSASSPKTRAPATPDWQTRAKRIGLNPKYTFDAFVVGSSNQFAHAASHAVAEKSPRTYNPLFIYGGVGLGKTHLLNAIGNFKLANYPDIRVCYVHSESFMNELIQALANKKMPEFREKYRRMDVLLMDDIQFISGKERTQEEFFHTFNALYESHRNIVVTSDKFPKDIPGLEDRLRSRFEWGLIADIQAPDMETKVAILRKKAQVESVPLPDDVAHFLAKHFTSNIRELEGALVRIGAFASLTHAPITIELARGVLKDLIRDTAREITVDRVVKAVCSHFQVSVTDLRGKRRTRAIALPRQIAMYLARDLTACSFPEIGSKIGGRDHSTVMYACSKIAESLSSDAELRSHVDAIRASLGP